MKRTVKIIIILFWVSSYSQDSRLFENTWYLQELIIDDIHLIPPINEEIPYVPAQFVEPNGFFTGMCESSGAGQVIYNGTTEFLLESLGFLAGGCSQYLGINEVFDQQYMQFWNIEQNLHTYTIVENEDNRRLTIVSSSGDTAIFGNQLLSRSDFNSTLFSIYPNPTSGIIFVGNNKTTNVSKITIRDLTGKLLFSFKPTSGNNKIDIQSIKNGLYLISIELDSKSVLTKKIIKL